MYFKPKTAIFTFHSVPSAQPRSSTGPGLLPRVFCWDWKFCASGTCSVMLGQQAAGPWQKWCCNRNISKSPYEQQRRLETHRNEARKILSQQKLELFHSAPSQCFPSSHFLTEKEEQDSQLLVSSSQGATPAFYAPCLLRQGQKWRKLSPSAVLALGTLWAFVLIQHNPASPAAPTSAPEEHP